MPQAPRRAPPLRRPASRVAERLLAVQGQDPRGARLAVRARTEGLTAADVDRALSEERSLLITWLNRGTLHLVRSEDYPWLQALTTPPLLTAQRAPAARRRACRPSAAERGGGDDRAGARRRGAADRARSCASGSTRPACRPRARRWSTSASSPPLRGIARARADGRQASTPTSSSATGSAPQQPVDRDAALAELARRYLVGHAPGRRPRPRPLGGAAAARRPRRPRRRSPPSWASARTACVDLAKRAAGRPSCRRRACSAPSTRCCSAGPRARRSSARTRMLVTTTASSGPSPWSTAAPSRPGGCAGGKVDDRAARQDHEEGGRGARGRRRRRRALHGRLTQ